MHLPRLSILRRTFLNQILAGAACAASLTLSLFPAASAQSAIPILFVGNSYTYGYLGTANYYNANTITDENNDTPPYGGVPAIFKEFTVERGLNYDVHIEAVGGQTLQYHLENKAAIIGQPKWEVVVLQGLSTEATIQGASATPGYTAGNRPTFIAKAQQLEQLVHSFSPAAKIYLYATWGRADLTYEPNGPYYGQPIEAMGNEVYDGYSQAFASDPNFTGLVPAGEAWLRAIVQGVAVRNPLDPVEMASGKLDLWADDYYHASNYGYYLNALLLFGKITGEDPRVLGGGEQAAAALNITPPQASALQSLAYAQLNAPTPGVVSRKTHGPAGVFDLPLPMSGPVAVECRQADPNNGGHQLIFTFADTLTAAGIATVSQGTATPVTPVLGPEPNQVTVNLTSVPNAQHLVVTLDQMQDGSKVTILPAVSAPMDVLFGDVNGSGRTDNGDVIAVRNRSVQPVDATNFRFDVNLSGRIDNGDVIVTRNQSVSALPAAPASGSTP